MLKNLINKTKVLLEMIKFEHTLFAIPFAIIAMMLAANVIPTLYQMFWILIALSFARTVAMLWNRIVEMYSSALRPLQDKLLLPAFDPSAAGHTWQGYTLRIIKDALLINRDEFIQELKQKGVEASVHYIPLHIHPYYSKKYKYAYNLLPNTYDSYTSAVSLPLYAQLSDDDAAYVAQSVIDVVKRYAR